MSNPMVVRGGELKVYVNNNLLGIVTEMSFRSTNNAKPIYGLDSSEPFEIAETVNHVSGQLTVVRLRGDGGMEGRGLMASPAKVHLEKYSTIYVIHRFTDTVIFACDRARLTDQQWSVSAKGIMTGRVSFEGIGWINESGR